LFACCRFIVVRRFPIPETLTSGRVAYARTLRRRSRIEIDTSVAERALRGVALGRRNFLFVGAASGGERAAATYGLIGTIKLNGLDPKLGCAMC
jgi:hypothetical protein